MDDLIAVAIHDAKNRLGSIDLLLTNAQGEKPSPALAEAQQLTRDINRQLVELLGFYRDGAGMLRLMIDDHDLADFCNDVCAEFLLPPDSGLTLKTDVSAANALGAWAFDRYQVQLVLLDAMRNAARYARTSIMFRLESTERGVCFVISDDGPGFPPEILAGADAAMVPGSTGLGLRFARLIASRHTTPDGRNGKVDLRNTPGAELRLCLP